MAEILKRQENNLDTSVVFCIKATEGPYEPVSLIFDRILVKVGAKGEPVEMSDQGGSNDSSDEEKRNFTGGSSGTQWEENEQN